MTRLSTLAVATIVLLLLGLVVPAGDAVSQQPAKTLKQQLAGTWTFVSAVNERKDGSKFDPWGPNPKGLLVLTPNGRFSLQIMRSDRPKFASNNRMEGTPEENRAAVQGMISSFGTYSVNEKDRTFTTHVEGSSIPNQEGTDQKRPFTITGDELKYTNPVTTMGGLPAHSAWKRAK